MACLFILFTVSLKDKTFFFFNFDKVQLIFFFLLVTYLKKKIFANSRSQRFFYYVFFLKFYRLRFYIYIYDLFWVNIWIWCTVWTEVQFFFPCAYSIVSAPFVEKTVFCPPNNIYTLFKNQLLLCVDLFMDSLFCFIDLFFILMPILYHTLLVTIALWCLEIRWC